MPGNEKTENGLRPRCSSLTWARVACIIFAPMTFIFGFATIKILGVFFIHLQDSFDATAATVSFTLSLPISTVFLGGPLYGSIFNLFGVKISYVFAALLACTGYSLASFAQTTLQLQVCLAIFGVGAGIINISTLTVIGRCFHKTRSIGMGVVAMSGALCSAVGNPVMQMLTDEYSWRGAIAILGSLMLNTIPCAMIVERVDDVIQKHKTRQTIGQTVAMLHGKEHSLKTDCNHNDEVVDSTDTSSTRFIRNSTSASFNSSTRKYSRRRSLKRSASVISAKAADAMEISLLKDILFVAYCVAVGITICARLLSGLYMVRYAQSRGVNDLNAAGLVSLTEISAFIMTPIASLLMTIQCKKTIRFGSFAFTISSIRRSYVLVIFQFSMSLVLIFPTLSQNPDVLTAYAVLLGLCFGGITPLPNIVIIDMFGTSRIAGAMGYRSLFTGISLLTIPVLTGMLIDKFGTYDVAQYSTSSLSFVSGVVTLIVQLCLTRREKP